MQFLCLCYRYTWSFLAGPSPYVNVFNNVFGTLSAAIGEVRPVLNGAQCVGTESSLLDCPNNAGLSIDIECSGSSDAGVDCAGRTERELYSVL